MSVLMPDRSLAVEKRGSGAVDAHGEPVGGPWGVRTGPWPGRAMEAADGTWTLAVDPQAWPLTAGDAVIETATGRRWMVSAARLIKNNLDPVVDYVRVSAWERVDSATETPVGGQRPTTHA